MLDMYILKIFHVQILIPRDVMDFIICQPKIENDTFYTVYFACF